MPWWKLENLKPTQLSDSQFSFYYLLLNRDVYSLTNNHPNNPKKYIFLFSKCNRREMSEAWASGGHLFRQTGTNELSIREHQTLVSIETNTNIVSTFYSLF